MNLRNQEFIVIPYARGNGECTVSFMKELQTLYPDKKLIMIWDRASYHKCKKVRAYLSQANQGLEEKDWNVTCLPFAPNAPDQNPVEDVWLQGKNFLRRHFYENKNFNQVKQSGSSRVLVESSETDQHSLLKVSKITQTVTHSFHCFNRVVNAFNHACCEAMNEVV